MRMAPSWHEGLVDAFPVPLEHRDGRTSVLEPESYVANTESFRFLDLPSELRNRIYFILLFTKAPYRRPGQAKFPSRTTIFLVSRQLHDEATYIFYTSQPFRIFPLQDFLPLPTIRELPFRYRKLVTNLEMVVGPGWTKPPRSWAVTKFMAKCLASAEAAQTLKVFVEVDPSQPIFKNFRISEGFYTDFCGDLLSRILAVMPQLNCVELGANRSVNLNGPLISRLRSDAEAQNRLVKWDKIRT